MSDPIERLNTALGDRYTIERELGEGGMATVYLADDLKHERNVALKVLKPELAAMMGAERFLSEIRTTANLQHPHILPLFDSGEADSLLYYVMPHVEGETLRDRLDREKQLPIDEAVRISVEVAEALEYAHAHGVIHRDIKPANTLLHDGRVLVADFGIALAVSAAGGTRLTETGLSVGTPQYMSPEQATGDREIDGRSDLYSLGSVTYEMLAGQPPYVGATAQAILASVLTGRPRAVSELRDTVPAHVEGAVHNALERMPADRFVNAEQYRRALTEPGLAVASSSSRTVSIGARPTGMRIAALAAAVLLGAGAAWALTSADRVTADVKTTYLSLATPAGVAPVDNSWRSTMAISPDGRKVIYVGSSRGQPLYLLDLDVLGEARPIAGTAGAVAPSFSPDGEWLLFGADNALQKISLSGGAPTRLADAAFFRGGTWSPDGATIYYSPRSSRGFFRVSADGGEALEITTPAGDGLDNEHFYPYALPDGDGVLFSSCCSRPFVMHLSLSSGEVTPLVEGFSGKYASTGHLVYMQPGSVLAAKCDPATLELGPSVEVADDVLDGYDTHADYDLSRSGSLVYLSGPSSFERTLVQYDRAGVREQIYSDPQGFSLGVAVSPDGTRLAVPVASPIQADVYLFDVGRRDLDPLVIHPANDFWPVWSPDGAFLAFSSVRDGPVSLFVVPTDRSAPPRPVLPGPDATWAGSWSPDGRLLAFRQEHAETGMDIWLYSFDDEDASPTRAEPFNEQLADFSPDGRWLAYQADDTGRFEVFVVPFPSMAPRCKVSTAGGAEPRWSGDGDELFYRSGRTAMVVSAAAITSCASRPPEAEALFDGLEEEMWDVHPSGNLFFALDPQPEPRLRLIQNWTEVLKERVPN